MRSFSPIRAAVVLIVIACFLVGMTARVAYLETYNRQQVRIIKSLERQQHTTSTIPARRGGIYDRNGVPLVGTVQTLAVYVDPKFLFQEYQKAPRNLNQMDEALAKLAGLVDVKVEDLNAKLAQNRDSRYWKIVENQSERVGEEVMKLKVPGLGVEPMNVRFYPMGSIAAHVLGSVGAYGNGLEGLELKYQKELAGRDGLKRVEKDASRRPIAIDAEDYVPPVHGEHLVLTIDANIQMIAEQELTAAIEKYKAKRGEVVVMDPKTGEILALANYPTFDPQNQDATPPENRRNSAIVVPYEPGSTIKPFIVGPALAQNITRIGEIWPIPGAVYIPYGSRRITDVHVNGPLTTWDVLVKSSNIGMSMLGERMGNAKLHQALSSFGYGRTTGVELPGEGTGLLWQLKKWTHFSTESVSQGYELMVTPMQLCRAFCAYANGGKLVQPYIVKGILGPDGGVVSKRHHKTLDECPQVVSEEAASEIRRILVDVPIRGTARGKGSKFWTIYGKTGTAHIARKGGGYDPDLFNSSFIAGAPFESPRIVVAMIIHEPDRALGHYGGTVSGHAAVRVIERTLAYLQVPTSPEPPMPPAEIIPHLEGFDARLYHRTQVVSAEDEER